MSVLAAAAALAAFSRISFSSFNFLSSSPSCASCAFSDWISASFWLLDRWASSSAWAFAADAASSLCWIACACFSLSWSFVWSSALNDSLCAAACFNLWISLCMAWLVACMSLAFLASASFSAWAPVWCSFLRLAILPSYSCAVACLAWLTRDSIWLDNFFWSSSAWLYCFSRAPYLPLAEESWFFIWATWASNALPASELLAFASFRDLWSSPHVLALASWAALRSCAAFAFNSLACLANASFLDASRSAVSFFAEDFTSSRVCEACFLRLSIIDSCCFFVWARTE
mmetsp:Transcript_5383/g.16274  ORF Transcript_5383/g.16274 Transcript_5383/m.16274 type:complete len:287 (+) Transcript_5383:182-1042(+)